MCKKGFSYAEAMVTMLIVAIIMVATTPIITKRASTNKGQIWNWTGDGLGASTFFGTGGMQRVIIGADNVENESARLILYSADAPNGATTLPPIVKFFNLSNGNEIGRIVTTETSLGLGKEALENAAGTLMDTLQSTAVGAGALHNMTAPTDRANAKNTAIGYNACGEIKEGSGNICIGAEAGPTTATSSNQLYIDNEKTNEPLIHGNFFENAVTINGKLIVNDTRYGTFDVAQQLNMSSDARLKNIGKNFTAGLNELNKIQVKNFTFKKDKEKTPHVGVIAQELQKVFPNAVTKGDNGYLRIRQEDMFYAMINAIKELDIKSKKTNEKIQKMEKDIILLQEQNTMLMQKLEEMEQKMLAK